MAISQFSFVLSLGWQSWLVWFVQDVPSNFYFQWYLQRWLLTCLPLKYGSPRGCRECPFTARSLLWDPVLSAMSLSRCAGICMLLPSFAGFWEGCQGPLPLSMGGRMGILCCYKEASISTYIVKYPFSGATLLLQSLSWCKDQVLLISRCFPFPGTHSL